MSLPALAVPARTPGEAWAHPRARPHRLSVVSLTALAATVACFLFAGLGGCADEAATHALDGTAMAASGAAGRAERTYFELLEAATMWGRDGDTLSPYDAAGDEVLVFTLVESHDRPD